MNHEQRTSRLRAFSKIIYERLVETKEFKDPNLLPKDVTPLLSSLEIIELQIYTQDYDVNKTIIDGFVGSSNYDTFMKHLFKDSMKTVNYYVEQRVKLVNNILIAQKALDEFN